MRRIGIWAASAAALILGSCTQLLQQQQAPSPQPVQGEDGGEGQIAPNEDKGSEETDKDKAKEELDKREREELSSIVPSSEQQEAARNMLNEQREVAAPAPTVSSTESAEEIPTPVIDSNFGRPVPRGGGLRMGNLVPPEEAASRSENTAPKPNSVEMRGLRSPALPKGLPMDINGKLTPSN